MLTIVNEGSLCTIVNEESSLTIINKGLSLTIVNEGSSLTIVKETTNFIKNDHFEKRSFLKTIVLFSIFRRRFHNELIVFLKNENVNIRSYNFEIM